MKLNLKSARRLEKEIQETIRNITYNAAGTVTVSVYSDSPADDIDAAVNEACDSIDNILELTEIRYRIRDDIAKANSRCGITQAMSEERCLASQISFLTEITDDINIVSKKAKNELLNEILVKKESLTTTTSFSYNSESVVIGKAPVSEDKAQSLKDLLCSLKKRRQRLIDECSQKNLTETITLSGDDVELLTKYSLI